MLATKMLSSWNVFTIASLAAQSRLLNSGSSVRPHRPTARMMCSSPLPDYLEDLKAELESGEAQLFDVREPQEWQQGHLAQAVHVPLSDLMHGEKPVYDKNKLTYLHCAAGIRVHKAAPLLEQMGFERVVPLQEGFATLAGLGFPLSK